MALYGATFELTPREQGMKGAIARAHELAAKLASKPAVALRYALEAVNQGVNATLKEGQAIEAHLFGLCFATEDQSEGMAAFLEKRKAEWKGR